ncbi:hypothetical protein E4M02_06310 [Brevundimonas sp. S30B]|uniref:hypothetical protein n=1 Tax=unclassified Brevundimonas TaxID=2622653 RepID=UPI0010725E8E|nr:MULTISPECIES: hypothetical protein [unclassified Brevundimonas]QBX38037.1 hypothetical protein E4M01_09830 [Brevundimonas sp. MF30-B]TFW02609.1 hypothetical protein E4M02_06310 [Brevundimonas sp. S30B]
MIKRLCPVLAAAVLCGCSPEPSQERLVETGQGDAWLQPPAVEQVARTPSGLSVSGVTGPGARVVLRGGEGQAFAATAAPSGRFDIRLNAGEGDLILTPEVQHGQARAISPDRLVILSSGTTALLRVGDATRRLDEVRGELDAVDWDGRLMVLSGRVQPGGQAAVSLDGAAPTMLPSDAEGRWSLGATTAREVRVDKRAYRVPLMAGDAPGVERSGDGWIVRWSPPGGGRQAVWLPDRS